MAQPEELGRRNPMGTVHSSRRKGCSHEPAGNAADQDAHLPSRPNARKVHLPDNTAPCARPYPELDARTAKIHGRVGPSDRDRQFRTDPLDEEAPDPRGRDRAVVVRQPVRPHHGVLLHRDRADWPSRQRMVCRKSAARPARGWHSSSQSPEPASPAPPNAEREFSRRVWPLSPVQELACVRLRTRQASPGQAVVGDKVVEFTPEGKIVWEWDSFDHLDPNRIGYDALDAFWYIRGFPDHGDWTHCNGVCHDPSDDSVVLSLRLQDCVIKIDRASGELRWILGDHAGWREDLAKKLLTPKGKDFRWPWHGHNPRITPEGTIVMFDNAIYMARPGSEPVPYHKAFSRGVEYRVDEANMTVEQVWASVLRQEDIKERTWAMGDAHRFTETDTAMVIHSIAMPHGHDNIGMDKDDRSVRHVQEYPSYARILEYNRKDIADIVFDMTIRDENELIQWEAFSGVRVQSLYPDHMGVTIEEGDAFVQNPQMAS